MDKEAICYWVEIYANSANIGTSHFHTFISFGKKFGITSTTCQLDTSQWCFSSLLGRVAQLVGIFLIFMFSIVYVVSVANLNKWNRKKLCLFKLLKV